MSVLFSDKKGREFETPQFLAPLADTHGHLTIFEQTDAASALVRAARAGIRLFVAPIDVVSEVGLGKRFSNVEAFLRWFDEIKAAVAEQLSDIPFDVYFIAGAHPYGADGFDKQAMERLHLLLEDESCIGIGEIGFDFGPWAELGADVQEQAFRAQLELALERNLPLELHLRDPKDGEPIGHIMAERILREMGIPRAGCDLHCFTSGERVMEPFIEMGCYIAFGGALTFSRSDDIRAAAAACPRELILSETDCPFMAPVPLRGLECEPAMMTFTIQRLASLREEAGIARAEQTLEDLWQNACRFFGLSEILQG